MICGSAVFADGTAAVMETCTGDSQISVYIKGMEPDTENMDVSVGTLAADSFRMQKISELELPMRTLVLVDNSLSISESERDSVSELLQNLISDRMQNEEIAVGVFGEDISMLADYTADYAPLKQAIDGITYEDQDTYIIDVLYHLIAEQYADSAEDVYRRIILISDGVDNQSLGYTKDELHELIRKTPVPIYAVGCADNASEDELEEMFALSRMTSADYFLIGETDSLLDINNALNQDRDIVKLTVTPAQEMMDGSRKAVRITPFEGSPVTVEAVMPHNVQAQDTSAEDAQEDSQEKEDLEAEEDEDAAAAEEAEDAGDDNAEAAEETGQQGGNTLFFVIFFCVIGAIVIVLVIGIILIIKSRKGKKPSFETLDDTLMDQLNQSIQSGSGKTEIIGAFAPPSDDGNTVMIWNQQVTYQVVLTDVNSPARTFSVPLSQSIVIGRTKEVCDIALDFDKSVSGRHCEITVRDGRFYLRDLQSSNGTYVNDSKVLTESEIFSGNILRLGRAEMRFEVR